MQSMYQLVPRIECQFAADEYSIIQVSQKLAMLGYGDSRNGRIRLVNSEMLKLGVKG